jgi:hypothetical protein
MFEDIKAAAACLLWGNAHVTGAEGDILQKGWAEELILGILKEKPHRVPKMPPLGRGSHRNPFKKDLSFRGKQKPHDDPKERGLSRSVGPAKGYLLPFSNGKGGPVKERLSGGIAKGEGGEFKKRVQNQKHPPRKRRSVEKRRSIPREGGDELSEGGKNP